VDVSVLKEVSAVRLTGFPLSGKPGEAGNFMQKSIFKQPSKLHSSRCSAEEMKRKMKKLSDHVTITHLYYNN